MSPDGKVQVIVRSCKVPVRTFEANEPIFSTSGVFMGTRRNHHVVYGSTLCEDYLKAIQEGKKLSLNLGLELEVVDSARQGFFGKVLMSLGLDRAERLTIKVSPSLESERSEISKQPTRAR